MHIQRPGAILYFIYCIYIFILDALERKVNLEKIYLVDMTFIQVAEKLRKR